MFPVSNELPLNANPFDLHVLSTPPAFILSQDQTLRTVYVSEDTFDLMVAQAHLRELPITLQLLRCSLSELVV